MSSEIEYKTFKQPIAALSADDRVEDAANILLQRQEEAKRLALEQAQAYANATFNSMATTNGWQIQSITVQPVTAELDITERTETVFGHMVVYASMELKYELLQADAPATGSVSTPAPSTEKITNTISRDGTVSNSVDLIFPLSNEITLKVSELPQYTTKLSQLFKFYKQQLSLKGQEIKGYDITSEMGGLLLFFVQLDVALKSVENIKPSIVSNPEKMSVFDYTTITLRYIDLPIEEGTNTTGPVQTSFGAVAPIPEERNFSDGTKRKVRIYNRIDSVILNNEQTGDTLMTTVPLEGSILGINPSTLALIFNIKRIVDEQINSPIPMDLIMCRGRQTSLSKLEDTFKILGFDVNLLSSKVLVQDFLNAYIQPLKEIVAVTSPPVPKGCTDQVKERARYLSAAIALHDLQLLAIDKTNVDINSEINYVKNKKELLEINKICPESVSTLALFEEFDKVKGKLGKIFTDFLDKFNWACIIDEALKCVMPQLSCEEILRDISVDNFEQRLQTAFPHLKNVIKALSLNVQESIQKEEDRRLAAGEPPLSPAEKSQTILDIINSVIDLEALCKIDIQAIIALFENIGKIKLPSFNLFDWRFNFKVDFDIAMLQSILEALVALLEQLINELIGCDAWDGLIAGLINGNVDAPAGLVDEVASLLAGDFENGIIANRFSNFLTQSSDELARLIKFEGSIGNPLIGDISNQGTLGISGDQAGLVTENTTAVNAFGGLVRASTLTTGSATVFSGLDADVINATVTFDVTKLATSEGQKNFLKEIGKFQYEKRGDSQTVQRISDDSVVDLITNLKNIESSTLLGGRPQNAGSLGTTSTTQTQALTGDGSRRNRLPQGSNDVFTPYGARNKNRHILNALVMQNEIDGRSSLVMSQVSLADQVKEYIRTCFSLLSPSEVIDLISSRPSLEVKLTISGISKIRFPLLYALLQHPERHALLFGTLGRLTELNTLAPRLQLLATSPIVKTKMVDPNICRPFNSLYDFRKVLMEQTIAPELANKLMDDLVEDDRKRANNLIDNLAKAGKNTAATDLFTNPNALSINKNPDGSPIPEIDRVLDDTISNVFDQVKTIFDNEIEAFPNATADSITKSGRVNETLPFTAPSVRGFNSPPAPENPPKNPEFQSLLNSGLTPTGSDDSRFFDVNKTEKRIGGVFRQSFDNLSKKLELGEFELFQQRTDLTEQQIAALRANNAGSFIDVSNTPLEQQYIFKVDLSSSIAGDEDLRKYLSGDIGSILTQDYLKNSSNNQPSWFIEYKEFVDNRYRMILRTSGQIPNRSGPATSFNDKINLSGTLANLSSGLQTELEQINVNGIKNRVSVYASILSRNINNIFTRTGVPQNGLENLYISEILTTYRQLLLQSIIFGLNSSSQNNRLLRKIAADPQLFPDKKTELINLIDFSPLPTEQQIACGIDTHLLQTEAVKERIKDRLNNTTPDNLINTNSRVNTRYSDGKPGHLSEQMMVGLAETYIRTTVLHNIFKGLFVLDKYDFDLTKFSSADLIFEFLQNKIISDAKNAGLESDFNEEYKKIYELYKKQELLSEQDDGSNPLKSIIKYQVESSLEFISKMLGVKKTLPPIQTAIFLNTTIPNPTNLDPLATQKREQFFTNTPLLDVYSNSLRYLNEGTIIPAHEESFPPSVDPETGEEIPGGAVVVPEKNLPISNENLGYESNSSYFDNILARANFFNENSVKSGTIILVLEKYVKVEWNTPYVSLNSQYDETVRNLRNPKIENTSDLDSNSFYVTNGVVNIANFQQIMQKLCNVYESNKPIALYVENNAASVFKAAPKFGLRLSMIKMLDKDSSYQIENNESPYGSYYQLAEQKRYFSSNTQNALEKRGVLRCIKKGFAPRGPLYNYDVQTPVTTEYVRDFQCTPLIEKEIEFPEYMNFISLDSLPLENTPAPDAWTRSDFIQNEYQKAFNTYLKQTMLNDSTFDLLVNYSLDVEMAPTLALFNSFLGMNNEPLFRLLDGTKEFIKKNYITNKNSGNFKNRAKKNNYLKNKNSKQSGPPAVDYLKAATTMPINLLKGMATAIDPNIFLADKIVLAGKMGFIQPKFKRVEVGDVIKIENSNETHTITSGEDGVAYDGTYIYAPNGELIMKANPSGQGSPITEFTVVALVEDDKVKKDSEGNVITAQGIGNSGVPYDIKAKKYIDENIDEENVTTFDIRPSTPIFPGEKINIPYSVASLLLAPLPVFGPSSLTTYNMLMPFGPIFLALEPLIYETPEFKASMPKTNKATNTGANLKCDS